MNNGGSKNPQEFLPTRQSLLGRLRNYDDSTSWGDFFHTYWKLIYSVAIRSGLSEVEAQEAVQETIIAVSKKMPDFKYDPALGSFKAWLLNLTRWRIHDQFRKRRREMGGMHRAAEDASAVFDRIPDPAGCDLDAVWEQEWQTNLLERALERVKKQVSARQYQIFDLYVNKSWPVDKIVRTLRVSPNQVYLAKHRVSDLLRKEAEGIETSLE